MRCGRVDLKSGEEVGAHNTGAHEEMLVIIEGAGVAELAATPMRIEAGQVLYVPPETPHNIRNVDSPRLRYLFIVAPVTPAVRRQAP
jgi:mannose-6-phosphate isomerase-like protein (cupin superfamily)